MKVAQFFCWSLFLSLCEATEYYVRPTEPTDTSCPAQPCLTFSQYISDSDLYFKSNTVFKFLPGLHHANQTLGMESVENVSLEGEQSTTHPILMMDMHCSSYGCSVFYFYSIRNLTIHSLNISVYVAILHMQSIKSDVSGLMFLDVSNVQIYNASVKFTSLGFVISSAIAAFDSKHIFLHSLTTICDINYCSVIYIEDSDDILVENVSMAFGIIGLLVMDSKNINISDTETMFTSSLGMDLRSNIAMNIYNVAVKRSKEGGIYIDSCQYTTISNTVVIRAQGSGIWLNNSINADIVNTRVSYSGCAGLDLSFVHHVTLTNTHVSVSFNDGIDVLFSTNITFFETSVMYIGMENFTDEAQIGKNNTHSCNYSVSSGFYLHDVNSVLLCNVRVMHFNTGIDVSSCANITIKNTTVTQRITSFNGHNIHVSGMTFYTPNSGMYIAESEYFVIANVTIVFTQLQEYAVRLTACENIHIKNILLLPRFLVKTNKLHPAIGIGSCTGVTISKSVFANFNTSHTITGQPAIVSLLYSSNIDFNDCSFEKNNITALHVVCSQFSVLGTLQFSGNKAYKGGAIFSFGSTMKLSRNGSGFFVDNHAIFKGGAIYLDSSDSYFCWKQELFGCFLELEQWDSTTRLTFVNNSAEHGGDAVYGRMCDTQQCMKCSLTFDKRSLISPDTQSQVASDPIRVCICNANIPECHVSNMAVDPIFPGQSFRISTVIVGEELGTVAGSVFANFLPLHSMKPQLAAGEGTQRVTQLPCNEVEYTIFSGNNKEVLVLTTINTVGEYTDPTLLTDLPMLINITLLPCPPGFTLMETSGRCDCSQFVQQLPGVTCNIKDQTIHRSGLVWVGSVKDENQTVENVITAKYCPLNYCKREGISVDLNQPDTQCEFNHSGILCGGCQPGLSLMLGGVQCEICSNKSLSLIIPFLMAGVVLVFFLKISNLTTSEGFINSLVFYASIVKANEHIFLPQANTNPLTLFISWLNLDLGVQTCFFSGLSAYTKTWLQFVFPFYIWGITGVIIISARYSIRIARISGNNSVPVLATLFLLSYAKLLGIIITSLSYTVLEYPGDQKVVWSADGNIDYLGLKHTPLFVAAVATLLFLWLPYTVLLFTGQWLYKCKLSSINCMLIKLKPFLDAHYGPLKDSHRYWFGALLLVRAVILLISALVTKNNFSIFIFSISIATFVLIILLTAFSHIGIDLRAYRSKAVSFFEYSVFFNLVVLCLAKYHTSVSGGSEIAASYTLIGSVFMQFTGLVIFRVYSIVKNTIFRYLPLSESQEEEGVWRYENSVEMQTTQYRNADNAL